MLRNMTKPITKHSIVLMAKPNHQMRKIFILVCLALSITSSGQGFQNFVNNLFATPAAQRQARVDSFMMANTDFPLIEYDTVANFIVTGNYNLAQVAGDMNGWDPATPSYTMLKVPSTNFFFLTKYFEASARLDYKLVTNGSNWILDPNNPNQVAGGFGPNSELAMPQFVQPWEILSYPAVPKGTVSLKTITSSIMSKTYEVQIYLPPGYDTSRLYSVAYFHDGQEYVDLGDAPNVLDNLIDSNLIEPLIGVFVKPTDRNEEYGFSKRFQYRDFFCDELVPWVDQSYATIPDSAHRATIGASFGGNISALIAFGRPDVFNKTGQHSGAWWPNNYEALNLFLSSTNMHMPMPSVWGTYEGNLTLMWNALEDSAQNNNYQNKYFNSNPEGHSWGLWRSTLDELLIFLYPGSSSIKIDESNLKAEWFAYPNPTSQYCLIAGDLNTESCFQLLDNNAKLVMNGTIGEERILDLSRLKAGAYFLIIDGSSQIILKRE